MTYANGNDQAPQLPQQPRQAIVRITAVHPDPCEGLKGHAYIAARNLNKPIQRVQTSAQRALADGNEGQ